MDLMKNMKRRFIEFKREYSLFQKIKDIDRKQKMNNEKNEEGKNGA
jgi:hypothetical protein